MPHILPDRTRLSQSSMSRTGSNPFIANFRDMTKLESGALTPKMSLHDLREIVGSALGRAGQILAQHHIDLRLAEDLPMISVDPVLFEQVIFNLLDNVSKYAPAETTVTIRSWHGSRNVYLHCRSLKPRR